MLLFMVVNLLCAGALGIRDKRSTQDESADLDAYSTISRAEAAKYLYEQHLMSIKGLEYEPWVQFREPTVHGQFLNTDENGFRRTVPAKTPPAGARRVYFFGGSTTFGYGVPDRHTIPSYFQQIADKGAPGPAVAKNCGRGYYYSSQELTLFEGLLKQGDVPDWAVFIDGTNEVGIGRRDEPHFTSTFKKMWNDANWPPGRPPLRQFDLSWLPAVRFGQRIMAKLNSKPLTAAEPDGEPDPAATLLTGGPSDVARYMATIRITRTLCKEYGVRCLFVWQPCPFYKWDRRLHKNFPNRYADQGWDAVYGQLEKYQSPDFLYLGSMLEHVTTKVFVDDVHYNESTGEAIAARVFERVQRMP